MSSTKPLYTSLTASTESQPAEQPAAPPPRCANWISYAVAVVQQAAPAADSTQAEG